MIVVFHLLWESALIDVDVNWFMGLGGSLVLLLLIQLERETVEILA